MGCGCGKKTQALNNQYVYTDPSGNSRVYNTQVQAEAAKVRNGGKGTITVRSR